MKRNLLKKSMAILMTLAMVLSLLPVIAITASAVTPDDENYDDNGDFASTAAEFTLDGIKYTLTRATWPPDTLVINQADPAGGSLLGNDGDDYYISIFADTVKIEAEDGSSFGLNSFSMDFFVDDNGDNYGDGDITITPSSGTPLKCTYSGSDVVENVNLSGNEDFQNITSVTFSGINLFLCLDDLDFESVAPTITSATYDASTGELVVTGAGMTAGDTIDTTALSLTGEGGNTYTLTSANVTADSATSFSVTLNATDALNVGGLLNKNGTASVGMTTYNLAAADDWDSAVTGGDTSDATNAVTVSNVQTPTITSATYNSATGVLTVTGTNMVSQAGATNDIDVSKLTVVGEGELTYTLNDSADVELTSGAAFTVTLSTDDRAAANLLFNKNGTSSTDNTTYNLKAADDWNGPIAGSNIADLTGNGITVSNANAAPVVSNLNGYSVTYTEDGSAVLLDSGANASLTDSDNTDFDSGNLTVSITDNCVSAEDVLSIQNNGSDAGQIGVSGSDVTYGSVIIGTYSGGTGTNNLVITFNSNSTPAAATALINALTYLNTNNSNPNTSPRTVSVTVNDGSGGTSAAASVTVNITAVNDAPTLSATGGTPTYIENGSAVDLFSGVSISTVESGQTITGLTLTVSNIADGASEGLSVDGSNIVLTNGASGTTATNDLSFSVSVSGTPQR